MRSQLLLLSLLACGCQPTTEISWLSGFGFEWTGFNHRVSYLHWDVVDSGLDMAVIGGASSTAYVPELPDGCEPELCDELPFEDSTTIDFAWGRTTTGLATGSAEATVIATSTGGSTALEIPLDGKGQGAAAVLLQAVILDTDHELSGGPNCFIPSLGWHPRRIALALVDPQLADDGRSVSVALEGSFEAGLSFEEYRACQDEVADQAQVPITVRALAVATPDGIEQHDVAHERYYEWNGSQFDPDEQPDPDMADRPLALSWDQTIAGWSALDFHFHEEATDLRGAYLRSLSVALDADQGWASGHATNFSPGTQLSDFSYRFEGQVTAVQADGEVEAGNASFSEVEAELDDDYRPEIHHEGWK